MMRSLYSGVSGLQNHQVRMDVIGNNISNVNTTGFKRGRVNFQDMVSQLISGAARPGEERGGINPKQVGLGMTVASIDTIHTEGATQMTQKNDDLAIRGNGFFVLRQGDNTFYSRAGAFGLDAEGVLVNPANGLRVQGWMARELDGEFVINSSGDVENLLIPRGQKEPARATTRVWLASNLDKRTQAVVDPANEAELAAGTWVVNKIVYDGFGNENELQINFSRPAEPVNQWNAQVLVNGTEVSTFTLNFDNLGALVGLDGAVAEEGTPLEVPITFVVPESTEGQVGGEQTFTLSLGNSGSYTESVTQFASESSTKSYRQDGYTMGYLENFQIDDSGVIVGVFTNGARRVLGQLALAAFANPAGLEKTGETNFVQTNNSGDAIIGTVGMAGLGKIQAGSLEMSNVDLATEFTDMIVTQRGFQANSKTITTSDQMLQELLELKR